MLTRRRLLTGMGLLGGATLATRFALPAWLATGDVQPLDAETRAFVLRCQEGLLPSRVVDTHVHVAGDDTARTGCWLHPTWRSHFHPTRRLRMDLFMGGAGVDEVRGADDRYVERLLERHRAGQPAGRLLALAFDLRVDAGGAEQRDLSPMQVPDEYVLGLAEQHEELLAACSVHPYREDAVERLHRAVDRGAVACKWLPNAMGIDPASERCDPFYEALAARGLPLITHAGHETAVATEADQELGNPLRLRRALEHGVRVVVAHAGSDGEVVDIDRPEGRRERIPSFDAFLRLFDAPAFERLLCADLSAVTFLNRAGRPLETLLADVDRHHRLVNGSDYPLSAVPLLNSSWYLQSRGLLSEEDGRLCRKVWQANPLLYDLVLKRSLRVLRGGRALRFSPTVFEGGWLFDEVG